MFFLLLFEKKFATVKNLLEIKITIIISWWINYQFLNVTKSRHSLISLQEIGCNTQCGWEVFIPGIVFKLDVQLQIYEDTDNKNILIRYEL